MCQQAVPHDLLDRLTTKHKRISPSKHYQDLERTDPGPPSLRQRAIETPYESSLRVVPSFEANSDTEMQNLLSVQPYTILHRRL